MNILNSLYNFVYPAKKVTDKSTVEQINQSYKEKAEIVTQIYKKAIINYTNKGCFCAFPRFQQIIGIDCTSTHNSFKCFDTEILMGLIKEHFDIENSEQNDECTNKKWTCKNCKSTYEYGWSDFSIHIDRQKLKLVELKTISQGKPTENPIPIFVGLIGHSYPDYSVIKSVDEETFRKYICEE